MNLYNSFRELSGLRGQAFSHIDVLTDPTEKKAKDYIRGCYDGRDKSSVFKNLTIPNLEEKLLAKSLHAFSAYNLGVLFKNIIASELLNLQKSTFGKKEFDFEYIWFLACLYHDTICGLEHQRVPVALTPKEYLHQKGDGINYDIFDNSNLLNRIQVNHPIPQIVPTHSQSVVENYFRYRLEDGLVDHGITAGYLLYDKLAKNYINARDEAEQIYENGVFYTSKNGLLLISRPEQLWVFALVADAIMAHNIWFADRTSNDPEERRRIAYYEGHDLQDLITSDNNDHRIDIKVNPLSFFLGLIDTIEPVKYFRHVSPRYIWEHIVVEIKILRGRKELIISQCGNTLNFNEWHNEKMKNMHTWLKIQEVKEPTKGIISIMLP